MKFFHGDRAALKSALVKGDVDIAFRGLSAADIAETEKADDRGSGSVELVDGTGA